MMFKGLAFKKNSNRLLKICSDLITEYQKHDSKPSCLDDVIQLISKRVSASKAEISEWKDYDTDYIKIAHTLLANATFDLLSSGEYHIYYGVLNPMSCSDNLLDVYHSCMEYAIKIHEIDENTKTEQYKYLRECISQVG